MHTGNPFADVAVLLSPLFMRTYIVLMIIAVIAGTIFDMLHKKSGRFFMQQWLRKKAAATRPLSELQYVLLALRTLLWEVATSGEFCNPLRRISHLLLFYGFVIYLVSTIVLVFAYPLQSIPTPLFWPLLWNLGALMVLAGGGWFFFYIRVDVAKEGYPPWRLMRADLFIVSLLLSVAFALLWEIVQTFGAPTATLILFAIYLFFSTLLFVGVPWSKFAHMFYKPAAAFQRRVEEASGSSDLPTPAGQHRRR